MSAPASWMPTPAGLVRETLTVVAGALLAAWIISHWPAGRDYIRRAWNGPQP